MKTTLLSSAAIIALGATGATAADLGGGSDYYAPPASSASYGAPGVFGDAHLSATYFNADSNDDWSVDFGGVVTVPFGNGWNVALEGDAGYLFDAGDWVALATGHVFYLNQAWAAGIFGTITTEDQSSAGVEAAAFINNVDVIGTVEYMFEDPKFWGATAAANLYFDPNTAVTGTVGGAWSDDADDFQLASLGIEHRFDATPVSAYAEAGWTNFVDDSYSLTAGARFVFGAAGSTLQEYNRANPF
jgi:hypothetical protein